MNRVGLIFAMREELDEVLKQVEIEEEFTIFNLTFYRVVIKDITCILVECGVGKVNAARCSQIMIDVMKVDSIINVGVAGGVDSSLAVCDIVIGEKLVQHVLDVVIGKRLVQHDFDITAFDHAKGYIPNVGVYLDSDEYLLRVANEVSKEFTDIGFHNGVIASGDIFCTSDKMSQKINQKFKALCVDMEGASIAQVAYLSGIPFLVVRSISDIPNRITYEEFLESSSRLVAKFLISMLEKISISRI